MSNNNIEQLWARVDELSEKFNPLSEQYVPSFGKCDSLCGEIIRAISRISYRCWNDGDHIGVGYGNETCNGPARFLRENTNKEIAEIITDMWGICDDTFYIELLIDLSESVYDYVTENIDKLSKTETKDMFDYCRDEDFDNDDVEDDYYLEENDNEDI